MVGTAPAGRRVPADPARRRPWRCSRARRPAARGRGGAPRHRARPGLHRRAHPGFDAYEARPRRVGRPGRGHRLDRAEIERAARLLAPPSATIVCWAMGLTQHKHAVPTIQEIVNVLLLRGNIGKPGAGACARCAATPTSRATAPWASGRRPRTFLDRLDAEFGFTCPREHGFDTVEAIRAMRDGSPKVFMGMGGNFVSRHPGHRRHRGGAARCALTVQVSTKLNRSHVVHGRRGADPALPGPHRARHPGRRDSMVTVEDSMSMVHASRGRLQPAVAAGCAARSRSSAGWPGAAHRATDPCPWAGNDDYDPSATRSQRWSPGFEDFNAQGPPTRRLPLPHPPRDSASFPTASGKASFSVNAGMGAGPAGGLVLQTMRSHDQYNTTIYGLGRYYGVDGGRRVGVVHPTPTDRFALRAGKRVERLGFGFPQCHARLQEPRAEISCCSPSSPPVATPPPSPRTPTRGSGILTKNTPVSKR